MFNDVYGASPGNPARVGFDVDDDDDAENMVVFRGHRLTETDECHVFGCKEC